MLSDRRNSDCGKFCLGYLCIPLMLLICLCDRYTTRRFEDVVVSSLNVVNADGDLVARVGADTRGKGEVMVVVDEQGPFRVPFEDDSTELILWGQKGDRVVRVRPEDITGITFVGGVTDDKGRSALELTPR